MRYLPIIFYFDFYFITKYILLYFLIIDWYPALFDHFRETKDNILSVGWTTDDPRCRRLAIFRWGPVAADSWSGI